MAKRGLGAGVDALFNTGKAKPRTKAGTASDGKPVKLTVHIPRRQLAELEKVKAQERAEGKARKEATVTALVIAAIGEYLERRRK